MIGVEGKPAFGIDGPGQHPLQGFNGDADCRQDCRTVRFQRPKDGGSVQVDHKNHRYLGRKLVNTCHGGDIELKAPSVEHRLKEQIIVWLLRGIETDDRYVRFDRSRCHMSVIRETSGVSRARGGTRTGSHGLPSLGSGGNMRNPGQSDGRTSQSEAESVDMVRTTPSARTGEHNPSGQAA